ncbi:MAG: family 43 glycosylhydrolase [Oscillospiraceae bacterium]
MKYKNPIIPGCYPDPSVCCAEGKYYMVCSSFQYFPGVPLFESGDLVNWKQIGYVLTRHSQVMLDKVGSSGGVFAPTIRYNNGRFYMVTTNDTTHTNFYVYTDDIYGEWSEPVTVDQGGIDPSLLFDGEHTFFISNGEDDNGVNGVTQCEIDIESGKKLSPSKNIWKGSGGRYLESPHMYKINGEYYLMAAEGGTEYGHMITYARGSSVWGPFENYPKNPVLTNRNKAPYIIQGIGHGDLVTDRNGDWFVVSLGFRQIGIWQPYHNLGREVFLTPVHFADDGWFTAGNDGTADEEYEIKGDFIQNVLGEYTFKNTDPNIEWSYLRKHHPENYTLSDEKYILRGTDITLDEVDSPTFIALRQREFRFEMSADVTVDSGEGGITVYMCENEHYDIAVRKTDSGFEAVLKLNIGGIKHVQAALPLAEGKAKLIVRGDNYTYNFFAEINGSEEFLGSGQTKYLSAEVSSPFTGVMLGLYAVGDNNTAEFTDLSCRYNAD